MNIDFSDNKTIKISITVAIVITFATLFSNSNINEDLIIFGMFVINIISFMLISVLLCVIVLIICMFYWRNK